MDQEKWYQMPASQVIRIKKTDPHAGLTPKDATSRQEIYGANELVEKKRIPAFVLFLNQFKDFMVLVLVGAVLISGLLGEYLDAITIIAIILMNGILGFIQEFRAEKSLRALKEMSAPTARVIRNQSTVEVPAHDLVPGDIVILESGDRIPADIRWLHAEGLQVEESALTGESMAVMKHTEPIMESDVDLGDQKNMGFMGTLITRGRGKAVVVKTGMKTEMGKIADLIQSTDEMETPLQHRLEQLGKILIGIALVLTVMVVVAGIFHGQPAYGMFLAGVSLAVAAIPEGLPAIVTISLALGVQRMIRRKAIVRKLPSVETLGCASVICSDKTGTLTQNKMTVTKMWTEGTVVDVTGNGYDPNGELLGEDGQPIDLRRNHALRRLLQIGVLCNNATLEKQHAKEVHNRKKQKSLSRSSWEIKGDPTEGALLALGAKAGITTQSLEGLYERTKEFSFDSERKKMSIVVSHQGGTMLYTKGAPDLLLQSCTYLLWDGKIRRLTDEWKEKVLAMNEQMAQSALRVLGTAYKELNRQEKELAEATDDPAELEQGLIFVGLTGMIDPPRVEVKDAIWKCKQAGIKTVMITGDHQTTAEAIAKKLGITEKGGLILNGRELSGLSDDELDQKVDHTHVYARVTPEHKLRIVKSLQRKGHVVAMTGDGVNDAPAIKAADIGIAMGITGTDVSKEASSLVLNDDNFATIVSAIEEGRGIYENIRKFIRYMLASNVGEILTMFIAMMMGMPLPLVPIMILWVNLVTDGLPAMALAVDSAEDDLMRQKPRGAKENIFARKLGWKVVSRGILIGICTLGAFWLVLKDHPGNPAMLTQAQTVAFATLVMAQLIHVFDCRSAYSIFHRNIFENKYLVAAVVSSIFLLLVVIYMEPLQPIFKTAPLDFREWAIVLVFAGIPTFLVGAGSVLKNMFRKKRTIQFSSQ